MKFNLGQVVATAGVANAMNDSIEFSKDVYEAFERYVGGDWGCVDKTDWESNDAAAAGNDRIVAAYETICGRIWIITEWDRSVTTILFPSEY